MSYWLNAANYDPTCWIWLPYDLEEDDRDTLREEAMVTAKAWCDDWEGQLQRPLDPEELTDVLVGSVIRYASAFPGLPLYLHMQTPFDTPIPLYTGFFDMDGDRESELRALTQADEEGAVERPIVEEFHTEHLGSGLRVLRYEKDAEDNLIACLRYAWRVEEADTDVVLITACPEPGRLLQAMDDIDEFARIAWLDRVVPDGDW